MKSEGMAWPQNSAELGQRGSQRGAAEDEEKAALADKTTVPLSCSPGSVSAVLDLRGDALCIFQCSRPSSCAPPALGEAAHSAHFNCRVQTTWPPCS
ncbi:hypothetical protein MHYP_G00060510 [Metynnis hypsauchen]